jgi:hypothetical protein
MNIVKNVNTLKAMQKQGVILCDQTGTKITGLYSPKTFKCYYVDSAPFKFEYRGRFYGQKYFDGCFYPYVVELDVPYNK